MLMFLEKSQVNKNKKNAKSKHGKTLGLDPFVLEDCRQRYRVIGNDAREGIVAHRFARLVVCIRAGGRAARYAECCCSTHIYLCRVNHPAETCMTVLHVEC